MKITLIVPGGVDRGGQERVVPALLWLIERLARRHRVRVVALNQYEEFCRYALLGAEVVNLGRLPGRVNELKLPQRLAQIGRVLADEPPDVVHAFGAGDCGLLATLTGRRRRLPVVVSIWSGELVWLPPIRYGWGGSWRSRLPVWLAQRLATVVTAGSRYALAPLGGRGQWLPLGAPAPVDRPAPAAGPPWRLLHVAHMNPVKDQATLLRALRLVVDEMPAVRLDWVGADTLAGRLPAECAALHLEDHVHFHGYQPPAALGRYFQAAHLLLQSSLHESQGVVVCEAAAAGVPTAGTAVGLVAELAPAAAAAVAPGDAPALAATVIDLLGDDNRRRQLGKAAREWAAAHDADWTAAQFEAIYERICSR